jgi:hypothetical protein
VWTASWRFGVVRVAAENCLAVILFCQEFEIRAYLSATPRLHHHQPQLYIGKVDSILLGFKSVILFAHVYICISDAIVTPRLYNLKLVVNVCSILLVTNMPRRLHLSCQSCVVLLDASLVVAAEGVAAQVRVVVVEVCLCLLRCLGIARLERSACVIGMENNEAYLDDTADKV